MLPEKFFNTASRYSSDSIFGSAFFSRRLNPFLEGREGNNDSMVSPESPTGISIGRAIFDDKAEGGIDHLFGVVRAGLGDVGKVNVKVGFAFTAIVNGVPQDDVDGTTGVDIAEVMQGTLSNVVLSCEVAALGTSAFFSNAGAFLNEGAGQGVRMNAFCGWVGHVSTGTGHGEIFLESKL